jgi:hypothetical protein
MGLYFFNYIYILIFLIFILLYILFNMAELILPEDSPYYCCGDNDNYQIKKNNHYFLCEFVFCLFSPILCVLFLLFFK